MKPRPIFIPGKDRLPIVQEAGWAPGPVWTGAENLTAHQDSIPGPSSPYPVAIPTTLPGPLLPYGLLKLCALENDFYISRNMSLFKNKVHWLNLFVTDTQFFIS